MSGGGGRPAMEGERGQAGKLQCDEENPFRWLARAEKGRRWWRGGELPAAAVAGCGGELCSWPWQLGGGGGASRGGGEAAWAGTHGTRECSSGAVGDLSTALLDLVCMCVDASGD